MSTKKKTNNKRKKGPPKKDGFLSGFSLSSGGLKKNAIDSSLTVGSALIASAAGAAIGKWSVVPAVPLAICGVVKKSPVLTAAGIGMLFGYKASTGAALSGLGEASDLTGFESGIEGFSAQDALTGAKARLENWLKSTGEIFMPFKASAPATSKSVKGIGEGTWMQEAGGMAAIDDALNGDELIGAIEFNGLGSWKTQADPDGQTVMGFTLEGEMM